MRIIYQLVHVKDILRHFNDKEEALKIHKETAIGFEDYFEDAYKVSNNGTMFVPVSKNVKLYEVVEDRFCKVQSSKRIA